MRHKCRARNGGFRVANDLRQDWFVSCAIVRANPRPPAGALVEPRRGTPPRGEFHDAQHDTSHRPRAGARRPGGAAVDTVDVRLDHASIRSVSRRAVASVDSPGARHRRPLCEILGIAARDVTNPIANDLQLVVSTWGSYELADRAGTTARARTSPATSSPATCPAASSATGSRCGSAAHRDDRRRADDPARRRRGGGDAAVRIRFSGYAGVPVSQRFSSRSGVRSWNPVAGDLAYGGRAAFFYAIPGYLGARPRPAPRRTSWRTTATPSARRSARTSASSRSRRTSPCSASARSASTTSVSPRGTWR